MNKEVLLQNLDKVHTTEMGIDRIKKNLKLDTNNVVDFCKSKVLDKKCNIYKQGKNWYCEIDNIKKAEISQSGRLVCKILYIRTLPVTTVAWKTCNQLHLTDLQYSV